MAGLRRPGRGTLVWRRGRSGVVPLLLGSGALPTTVCPSASGARNAAGPVAAGQPDGARGVAAGASVDRTRTILREKPTRLERHVLQQPAVHLGDGTAGGCGRVLRARALLGRPPGRSLLANLMAFQLPLELGEETMTPFSPAQNTNPQNPQ